MTKPTVTLPARLPLDQELFGAKQEAAGEHYCRCTPACNGRVHESRMRPCPTCLQCRAP